MMSDFVQFLADLFTATVFYLSGIGIAIAVILIWIRTLKDDK